MFGNPTSKTNVLVLGGGARPELVMWNGTPSPLEIFTSSPHRKDSLSPATSKVSNEMEGMQALKEAETARD
ncbi:hypothetical protein ACL6C3_11360 [Capilliphycus salinus ALCB114379]|uniref:hypothetical protein n=1 Tax=Capilliphycus salinus TaxID=2768948 RepID=UPI0039A66CD4